MGSGRLANVSVVIPCYESSKTIGRCLDSIVGQYLQPFEIIIVIDKSSDIKDTVGIINGYMQTYKYINIYIKIPESRAGVARSRNIGWEMASGKYIAFLDSDDIWDKNKIHRQFNFMEANETVDVVCASTALYFEKGAECVGNWLIYPVNKYSMLFKNQMITRTVLLRSSILFRFETGKQHSEDYLLWLEMSFENLNIVRLSEVLAYSFKTDYCDSGLASNLEMAEKGEIDTLRKIFRKYELCPILFPIVLIFSLMKYIRRKFGKFSYTLKGA